MEEKIKISVPNYWEKIDIKDYPKYKIILNTNSPCYGAWKAKNDVVSIIDYSKFEKQLGDSLEKIYDEMDKKIKESEASDGERLFYRVVCHEQFEIEHERFYTIITEVTDDDLNVKQVLQIFVKQERLLCFTIVCEKTNFTDMENYLRNCDSVVPETINMILKSKF